jgi:hypothetical protein
MTDKYQKGLSLVKDHLSQTLNAMKVANEVFKEAGL